MNMQLDFIKLKDTVLDILSSDSHIILSTSQDKNVSSRLVDFVPLDLKLGFFTWIDSRKYKHIKQNSNVSLCLENLQVEGSAFIHENHYSCSDFIDMYSKKLPDIYRKFSRLDNTCFVTVEPERFIVMKYESEALYLDHLDLNTSTSYRKKLSNWK